MAMLNGGELNGFRVLSEESVTEMLAPQGHALAVGHTAGSCSKASSGASIGRTAGFDASIMRVGHMSAFKHRPRAGR